MFDAKDLSYGEILKLIMLIAVIIIIIIFLTKGLGSLGVKWS